MSKTTDAGTNDSGQSDVTETVSAEERAAVAALEDDSTDWSDGEEVESRFEADEEDDSAATDEDDSDDSDFDDSVESEDDADSDEEDSDQADDSDEADRNDPTDPEAERKRYNDEMARARIAERKAREEAEALRRERQESSIQRYLDEAADDEVEFERRQNDVEQFRLQEERIALNTERLDNDIERAVVSIDLFRTGSQAAKEELVASIDDFERQFIETDRQGRPVNIKIDPVTGRRADVVTYLQRKAEAIKRLQGEGATQQVRKKKSEKSRTMAPPARAPKKAKVDDDLAAFDEEAAK